MEGVNFFSLITLTQLKIPKGTPIISHISLSNQSQNLFFSISYYFTLTIRRVTTGTTDGPPDPSTGWVPPGVSSRSKPRV